ncbi:unnamed protein product, partial [Polarella glacialis]
AHPGMVRRAFSLESKEASSGPEVRSGRTSASSSSSKTEDPLERLLASRRVPAGPWYASFVVQRCRAALSSFLAETLPAGAPSFLLP